MEILKQLKTAVLLLLFFSILTGLLYPALVTGLAQCLFPWRANGSLIMQNNHWIGSELMGQYFTDPRYFWGRPSATLLFPYDAKHSSGSNLGPSNPRLLEVVKERLLNLQKADPNNHRLVPIDLVTASGSGLDPEISLASAFYQVPRIANTRHLSENMLYQLIQKTMQNRTFGILGEARVNVLRLNLELDRYGEDQHATKTRKT
jgi:potassium-transporting ATPase KdpC subunit